tara:strand:- start:942 stop:1394 length:453 start_codon:yes stop_codon:yes gene_type:complete
MNKIITSLPVYEPKIDETSREKVDLNIRDLQKIYPDGCICCGTTFTYKKYSCMISQHFNTIKHKRKCILHANQLFKEDIGLSNNLCEAFDLKCKEMRELKKLNYKYKEELDNIIAKSNILEKLNIELQEKLSILNNKNNQYVNCGNLIDI